MYSIRIMYTFFLSLSLCLADIDIFDSIDYRINLPTQSFVASRKFCARF